MNPLPIGIITILFFNCMVPIFPGSNNFSNITPPWYLLDGIHHVGAQC
jgi:hypothetical protein